MTLGNLGYCAPNDGSPAGCAEQAGWGLANTAYFQNMQSFDYWSGTEYESPGSGFAWGFNAYNGGQFINPTRFWMYAVAVRTGDVAAPAPEPQTLALALLALGATVVARRRRPASRAPESVAV